MKQKIIYVAISFLFLFSVICFNALQAHAIIYVANSQGVESITAWPNYADGNVAPTTNIVGANTTLNYPKEVAVDDNWIYVANTQNDSVDIFPIDANGNIAPARSIQGANTTFNEPFGIAVDANWIYVSDRLANSITVFPIGADGNVAPTRTIQGANTTFNWARGIAVDANWIYAANQNNDSLLIFPIDADGNIAPARTLQGANTTFNQPMGVTADDNWIYVANYNNDSIDIFPIDADGNIAPTRSIQGANTTFNFVPGVAVDASWIYVTNRMQFSVVVFPIDADGNIAPTRTIQGASTTLNYPGGIAVSIPPEGIYVSPAGGGDGSKGNPTDLQSALNTAASNSSDNTIYVAQGTYTGNFLYTAASYEYYDLNLEGGWSSDFNTRTLDPSNTILDGNNTGRVLDVDNITNELTGSIKVEGFTIRNGQVSGMSGAGIFAGTRPPGTVEMDKNIFENNTTDWHGGGFYIFSQNSTDQTGAPLAVTDNIIRNNQAGNTSEVRTGAGGYIASSDTTVIANNLVYGNTALGDSTNEGQGGGFYISVNKGDVYLINNTIVSNNAWQFGGGIVAHGPAWAEADVHLYNNIIRGNTAPAWTASADIFNDISAAFPGNSFVLSHNNYANLLNFYISPTNLGGNINVDPAFVGGGDYHPTATECIDSGDNSATNLPDNDLDGYLRVIDGDGDFTATVDMGAYELCAMYLTDVQSHWAKDYITEIYCHGFTSGYGDNTYRPTIEVNRAQMAVYIVRSVEGDPAVDYCGTTDPFTDVPYTHWACPHIKRLAELGISTGYGDGTYKPTVTVNRAQMAVFIVRALYGDTFTYSGTPYFSDVPDTHWAFTYIQKLNEIGVSTGYPDGTYRPTLIVNRAQMAVFVARAFLGIP